ncbi:hypothetical protein ABT236_26560 [Streptomyces sp. NPDC001523]|uniref:hypothetical protein n=1 Tax=Streptomyces sp. NPDC001523 TaxID=3154383 RepID=UPI003326C4C4
MRPSRDRDIAPVASHTPIYDTLYSEYLRAFRTLPGDRTGEEDLGFTAFSYGGGHGGAGAGGGSYAAAWSTPSWQPVEAWQPAPYVPAPLPSYAHSTGSGQGQGQGQGYANGRQHQTGMQHVPAALPPAPRRGY